MALWVFIVPHFTLACLARLTHSGRNDSKLKIYSFKQDFVKKIFVSGWGKSPARKLMHVQYSLFVKF